MSGVAARCQWGWGTGTQSLQLNSTGAGTAFNTHGWGLNYTFFVENTDSAMSYQIRAGRTSSGPWAILSSASMTSTAQVDIVQLPGPLGWVSPRVDALSSTANSVIIRMSAVE